MATDLIEPCKEQVKAGKEADRIGTALSELAKKFGEQKKPEPQDPVQAVLADAEPALKTFVAAKQVDMIVNFPERRQQGSGYSITTLRAEGFCAVSAQLSTLVRTMNGDNEQPDYKSEKPTITGFDGYAYNKTLKSSTNRVEFQPGVTKGEEQLETMKNQTYATVAVLKDKNAGSEIRSQAVLDLQSYADQAIGAALEELTNSNLLKSTRNRDEKIVSFVENSVKMFREQFLTLQRSSASSTNADDYLKSIADFRAQCAALAKVE